MIQRIQTLFLAGVVVVCAALFYLPLYAYPDADAGTVHGYLASDMVMLVMNGIVMILAAAAVFMYRNRKNQVRMCGLAMLLVTAEVVRVFYMSDKPGLSTSFEAGSYLVLLSLVLLWLAIRSIRKDEQLVRSADRLR